MDQQRISQTLFHPPIVPANVSGRGARKTAGQAARRHHYSRNRIRWPGAGVFATAACEAANGSHGHIVIAEDLTAQPDSSKPPRRENCSLGFCHRRGLARNELHSASCAASVAATGMQLIDACLVSQSQNQALACRHIELSDTFDCQTRHRILRWKALSVTFHTGTMLQLFDSPSKCNSTHPASSCRSTDATRGSTGVSSVPSRVTNSSTMARSAASDSCL